MLALSSSWRRPAAISIGIIVTILVIVAWEALWLAVFGWILIGSPYFEQLKPLYLPGAVFPFLYLPFVAREIILGLMSGPAQARIAKAKTMLLALGPATMLITIAVANDLGLLPSGTRFTLELLSWFVSAFASLTGLLLGLSWRVWRVGSRFATMLLVVNAFWTLVAARYYFLQFFQSVVRPPT